MRQSSRCTAPTQGAVPPRPADRQATNMSAKSSLGTDAKGVAGGCLVAASASLLSRVWRVLLWELLGGAGRAWKCASGPASVSIHRTPLHQPGRHSKSDAFVKALVRSRGEGAIPSQAEELQKSHASFSYL